MRAEIIVAVVTTVVLVSVVAIRTATRGQVEITLNDAIIAAIAAGLTLLMSGSITKLAIGPTGVVVESAREAILSASARPVDKQVSVLPMAPFNESPKGGASQLPILVRRRVQGVDIRLGAGGYVPGILQQYLETLNQYPFFKGLVLLKSNNALFGVIDGRTLLASLQDPASGLTIPDFVKLLNGGNADDLAQIAKLAGFVPARDAVTPQTDKRAVLANMEKAAIDWWPVVNNAQDKVIGTVERARLISSLILDVTDQLKAGTPGNK